MSVTFSAVQPVRGGYHRHIDGSPELNVANGNFWALNAVLRLEAQEPCGTLDPGHLLDLIEDAVPEAGVRPPTDTGEDGPGCRLIEHGLDRDRIDRYLHALTCMAFFAFEHAGSEIQWA